MNEVDDIEKQLGVKFPDEYKNFLLKTDSFIIGNQFYCQVTQDNYRIDGSVVDKFYTVDNFIEKQNYRKYLIEHQAHFENPKDYVEAEYLYHIAEGTFSICIALEGRHYGKIFSADNGDYGIIYQAGNINAFIDSLYDPSKYQCTYEEIIKAVKTNDISLLAELVEKKDGNKQIEHNSWLDIELFDIAYESGFNNIIRYLISKGYEGHNRVDYYKIKY